MEETDNRTKQCEAKGCQKRVRWDILMCIGHWRMVPPTMQMRITRAWAVRNRFPTTENTAAHEAAKEAAIEAVALKERK